MVRDFRWGEIAVLVDWLRQALAETGVTQAELARRVGITSVTLNKILKGRRRVTGDELVKIAAALGVSPPKIPHSDNAETGLTADAIARKTAYLKIIGEVAGGHWIQMDIWDFDAFEVPYLLDPRWPEEAVMGLVVRGESINRQARDGDYVAVLDINAAPRAFQVGDWVVVRRRRADIVETTVKQVRGQPGAWELWPDSTDPRFQEPLVMDGDGTEEVEVVGFVLDFIRPGTRF